MFTSAGSSIKFWSKKSSKDYVLSQEVSTNAEDISSLSWNKDGQYLAALDKRSFEISMYAVSSNSSIKTGVLRIMDHPKCLQFANTTPRYLAVGGANDSVIIWDVKSNSKKKSFLVAGSGVSKISFNSVDSHLIGGTCHGDAFLMSNTNNVVTGPFKLFSEKSSILDIRYSHTNRALVGACSENGEVLLMDTNTTKIIKEFKDVHTAPASSIAFSPINELLMVSVGYDRKFISYNVNSKQKIVTHVSSAPLTSVCFMGNGQEVALGTMTGQILLHDLRCLKIPLATLSAHKGPVIDMQLQPENIA